MVQKGAGVNCASSALTIINSHIAGNVSTAVGRKAVVYVPHAAQLQLPIVLFRVIRPVKAMVCTPLVHVQSEIVFSGVIIEAISPFMI